MGLNGDSVEQLGESADIAGYLEVFDFTVDGALHNGTVGRRVRSIFNAVERTFEVQFDVDGMMAEGGGCCDAGIVDTEVVTQGVVLFLCIETQTECENGGS